jgi:mRNA interferase MazF
VALSSEIFSRRTGHSVLAMITSAQNPPWLFDVPIDAQKCGLRAPSKVRFKLFTLDNRLILHRVGTLADADRKRVTDTFHRVADL